MKLINILAYLSLTILFACNTHKEDVDIWQKKRNNIININNNIVNIDLESNSKTTIGRSFLHATEDKLIVCDMQSPDNGIHLFDLNTFKYLASTGKVGKGPNELIRYGRISSSLDQTDFYVADYGKMQVFKFNINDVLLNPYYLPQRAFKLGKDLFPTDYGFINDSIIIGTALDVVSNQDFRSVIVSGNIKNENYEIIQKPYHKTISKNLTTYFAISSDKQYIVEGYQKYDLLTISDFYGNVKHRIFGPQWNPKTDSKTYFSNIKVSNKYIIALYNGKNAKVYDQHKRAKMILPSQFLIFNNSGEYIATLDVGDEILDFVLDEKNNRIICYFENSKFPFSYIDLNGILDI